MPKIYTLGHSRHPIATFISILEQHGIRRVVDVRGQPYSRRNPQFNREQLSASLKAGDIDYTWSGEHLSGRPRDARYLGSAGEVLWDKLAAKPELESELRLLAEEARRVRLALVCAEEDPMRCHRRFLLTPFLMRIGVEVMHLRGDGRIEAETELAERESTDGDTKQPDLFGQS